MSATFNADSGSRRAERVRLFAQPVAVVVLLAAVLGWVFSRPLDSIERRNINLPTVLQLTGQHVSLSLVVAVIVVGVSVPLGTLLTRGWARPIAPVVLAVANVGQAAPSIGLLVLFFLLLGGTTGFWVAVGPIALYTLLPVLRNTMVGLRSVDPTLVEAGRGIGMPPGSVLLRIELPLAVPYILAGLRTALVLAVGTATLATFVSAGGLGDLIDTGYKLGRVSVLIAGAVLAMALALLVDWLGALAEEFLGPRGLR